MDKIKECYVCKKNKEWAVKVGERDPIPFCDDCWSKVAHIIGEFGILQPHKLEYLAYLYKHRFIDDDGDKKWKEAIKNL